MEVKFDLISPNVLQIKEVLRNKNLGAIGHEPFMLCYTLGGRFLSFVVLQEFSTFFCNFPYSPGRI